MAQQANLRQVSAKLDVSSAGRGDSFDVVLRVKG